MKHESVSTTCGRVAKQLIPALALFALGGCGGASHAAKKPDMTNPASSYCVKQGGKLEIRRGPGGETGYCHLAYGRVVEEWVLYRAAHPATDAH
ncbi:putative hemolysin [Swaminathania salitolerans]|uniref:Hemolysin n=1 Tax=Swaminathania salitolerans TaxID=182838 RepID=A0A511BN42_9PROT|nr:DUF333 domain-containing protein [Swaminathania salitolerans]GBQ10398.1 hypothetical protein AA21291_0414 [Swaminathania salitolerans LMG 21291]GEL01273.1 hypothetical protein SSA02_04360 [Swaminathania salitolerans]